MPRDVSDSALGYQHARWLEEGGTHRVETKLEELDSTDVADSEGYEEGKDDDENENDDESESASDMNDDADGTCGREEGEEHPNLRMQWKWTELRI